MKEPTGETGEENHCGHRLMSLLVVELEKRIQLLDMFLLALSVMALPCSFRISFKKINLEKVEKVK